MATERKRGDDGRVIYGNYGLSETARTTLKTHSAAWGTPESVILDYLCCTHLRAVKLVRWSDAPPDQAVADLAAEASCTVPMVPVGESDTPALPSDEATPPRQGRADARARRKTG
jgi:hypothetical protein